MPLPVFAVEGIGGAGKTHAQVCVSHHLQALGYSVLCFKVGGMGDSPRAQLLRHIQLGRKALSQSGQPSPKILLDMKTDRIYRIATRYQVRQFLRACSGSFDLAVIDRTPLMNWVHAAATDSSNDQLDVIRAESMDCTERLSINKLFLFDLSVETAYARMIARSCASFSNIHEIVGDACKAIRATEAETDAIVAKTFHLLGDPGAIRRKPLDDWYQLTPLSINRVARELHKQIVSYCRGAIGLDVEIVDAERPLEDVVMRIVNSIRLCVESGTVFRSKSHDA